MPHILKIIKYQIRQDMFSMKILNLQGIHRSSLICVEKSNNKQARINISYSEVDAHSLLIKVGYI